MWSEHMGLFRVSLFRNWTKENHDYGRTGPSEGMRRDRSDERELRSEDVVIVSSR